MKDQKTYIDVLQTCRPRRLGRDRGRAVTSCDCSTDEWSVDFTENTHSVGIHSRTKQFL